MNVSLIEKIKKLLLEAEESTTGSSVTAGELFSNNGEGGIHVVNPGQEKAEKNQWLDPKEAAAYKAQQAILDKLNRYKVTKTGRGGNIKKFVFTYEGKKDTRDWVPRLVTFSDERIKDADGNPISINVTVQTKKFLDKLLRNLFENVKDKVSGTEKPKIANIDISFEENKSDDEEFNGIITSLKSNFFDGIDPIREVVQEDNRFWPSSYVIHITAPIDKYSDESINQIKSFYDEKTLAADAATVKASIDKQKVNIDIVINKSTTLLPMYNTINYVPTNSKTGALDKLSWTYQRIRETNKSSAPNLAQHLDGLIQQYNEQLKNLNKQRKAKGAKIKEIDAAIKRVKDTLTKVKSTKASINKNQTLTYIDQQTFDDSSNTDTMSIGPLGLLAKARRITDAHENNSILVITSDVGTMYMWAPGDDNVQTLSVTKEETGKENGFAKHVKDYFEGLISKEAFSAYVDSMDIPISKKDIVEKFVSKYIERNYYNVYCMKMMFSDTVNVSYNMELPPSVLDTNAAIHQVSNSIKVPGSERLPKQKTSSFLRTSIDVGDSYKTKLVTVSHDILKTGSGSLGFFKDSIKTISGDFTSIRTFIENFMYMVSATKSVIYDFYVPITKKQFDTLKNGDIVTIEQNNRTIILDPNKNHALATIINSIGEYKKSVSLVLKYDKVGYNEAENNLSLLKRIFRGLLRQYQHIGWNEFKEFQKKLNDTISGYNSSIAGRPGIIDKMQNDMIIGIRGAKDLKQNISDVVVAHNLIKDAFPIIESYFASFKVKNTDDKSKKGKNEEMFVPALIHTTPTDGFNFGAARKGMHIDARASLIEQLYDFLVHGEDKVNKWIAKKSHNVNDIVETNLKIITYLDDTIKLLEKITAYDGVKMFEFEDVENIENVVGGIATEIDTKLTGAEISNKDFKIESVPSVDRSDDKDPHKYGIRDALETTKESDISSGLVISDACKKAFRPLVNTLKSMITETKNSMKEKPGPIMILPANGPVPYAPIHTVITLEHEGDNLLLVVISSCFSVDTSATKSFYNYSFDKEHSRFIIDDTTKIADDDKEDVQTALGQMDFAFCSFNMMSTKRLIINTSAAMKRIERQAIDGYHKLQLVARRIYAEMLAGASSDEEKERILMINNDNTKKPVKDIVKDIARYICIAALLLEVENNDDMEF